MKPKDYYKEIGQADWIIFLTLYANSVEKQL